MQIWLPGEPILHFSFLKKNDDIFVGRKILRNKYIKILGGIISSDVVMFTLFSLFSKFFTGVMCVL